MKYTSLKPDIFSIPAVLERMNKQGNPFRDFRENVEKKIFIDVLTQLKEVIKNF